MHRHPEGRGEISQGSVPELLRGSAYSSIRTYYGRIYEAKFITGAIAGAMAGDDRIGYIASYPIFGVPASITLLPWVPR